MAIITVDNLKTWLGITSTDDVDDTNLAIAVASANDAVTAHCGRSFEKETVASARVFRPRYLMLCDIDDVWSTTGLIVKTDSGDDGTYAQTWSASDYTLEPVNQRKNGLPWVYESIRAVESRWFPSDYTSRPYNVQVTALWGWPVIPEPVFNATLLKAARLFNRKDSPDGMLGGFSDLGPVRVSLKEDPDLQLLLRWYQRSSTRVLIA